MPLFLLRFPTGTTALIRADDEHDAWMKLPPGQDPEGVVIRKYDGPVWIEFTAPQPQASFHLLPDLDPNDELNGMTDRIVELAFPRYYAELARHWVQENIREGQREAGMEVAASMTLEEEKEHFGRLLARDLIEIERSWEELRPDYELLARPAATA